MSAVLQVSAALQVSLMLFASAKARLSTETLPPLADQTQRVDVPLQQAVPPLQHTGRRQPSPAQALFPAHLALPTQAGARARVGLLAQALLPTRPMFRPGFLRTSLSRIVRIATGPRSQPLPAMLRLTLTT